MSEEQQVSNEPVGNEDTKATETKTADVSELITESKKYRKRSQAAESRVAELEAKINSFEDKRLLEKEEFKTLYEKVSVENEANKAIANKWATYESAERETLLKQVSDDEKAEWENSPLNLLKKYVAKSTVKTNNPSHIDNLSRGKNQDLGGYKDTTEWAMKDPSGFTTYLENNVKGYIK